MTFNILQIVIILLIIAFGLVVPIGIYLVKVFTDERDTVLERITYRLLMVNPREQMTWQRHSIALVLSSLVMALLGYGLLRLQVIVFPAEQLGNPLLAKAGAGQVLSPLQSGGNLEGKETRFGIA